jgi:PAS domain S-box-containing protein
MNRLLKRNLREKIRNLDETRQRLITEESRFRSLFMYAPIPMLEMSMAPAFTGLNESFTRVFGYTIDDIASLDQWWVLAYPDESYRETLKREWSEKIEEAVKGNKRIEPKECFVRCKNGDIRSVMISARIIEDRMVISLYGRERSEKCAERDDEEPAPVRDAVRAYSLPCVIKDSHGRFMMANQYSAGHSD